MSDSVDNPRGRRERKLEEAIVPIRPASPDREPTDASKLPRPSRHIPVLAASLVLLALLVGVFVVLPRWVGGPSTGAPPEAAAAEPESAAPATPALSPEALEALKTSATDQLADVLELNEQLEARSAAVWGGDDWVAYTDTARAGDEAFLAEDFVAANERYESALTLGRQLLEASDEIMVAAMDAGDAALAAGNAGLAREQYQIVLSVDPDNARAAHGVERATALPEVLERVRDGDRRRDEGDLAGARDAYQAALALDPEWAPAETALREVRTAIANARFESRISAGFAALADEEFERAQGEFQAALKLKPASGAAHDGLAQAEQGMKLDTIALAEVRALAFERRELWDEAIAQYEAALDSDPTLAFAIEGLARAQARADLDRKLVNLIENPQLLLNDDMLSDARLIHEDARAVADTGPRIEGQTERLETLIDAATTPVTVRFESDQLTEVTVYRVGRLGSFTAKEIELRPGRYTVVGSRSGYRDVRTNVTVLPGRTVPPIKVVCVEPI